MATQRERDEEKRNAKLDEIKKQVKSGDLTIRKMTDAERKRHPPPPEGAPKRRPRRS
jgi:hypothetical protein